MRIDRDLYPKPHQQFEYVMQHSEEIKRVHETEGIDAVETFVKDEVLNKPTEYWTADKIRQSYEREHKVDQKKRRFIFILTSNYVTATRYQSR